MRRIGGSRQTPPTVQSEHTNLLSVPGHTHICAGPRKSAVPAHLRMVVSYLASKLASRTLPKGDLVDAVPFCSDATQLPVPIGNLIHLCFGME